MKDNLIKEVSYVNPKHKEVESCKSYCFTDKGKKFINQKYGIDRYDEYMEMLREQQLSAIDFTYINMQGIECGIEVTTNSYSDGDIAGKELCSEIINVPVSYVSV